jgi:hypothetical protein
VVANPGGTSIDGLTVTDIVPDELDVTGVPIVDAASAINLISIGSDEQIVWTIDELHPGAQVTLPWNASVSTTGDLVAMNEATATTEDSTARAAQNVYLARSSAPEVHGSTSAAAPATQTKKVIRYEQRRIPAGSAPAVIPFTGAPVWGWMVLALALIVVGAAFTRVRRSPLILCGLLALVLMAACTNAGQDPSAGAPTRSARPSPEGSTSEDEVLGTRIHRNSNGSPADGSATDGSSTDAAADATAADTTAPQIPEPQEDLVQVVSVPVVVEVESQPASEVLTSIEGDNFVTFSWDEMDRQVTDAASSRTLSRAASATLLSELSTASPSIAPSVELVNLSSTTLVVRGDLGIRTLDASGADAATTSEFVDVVLAPGGSVSLDFEYVLPSGDYSSVPFFAAG